jgi:FdhD protein
MAAKPTIQMSCASVPVVHEVEVMDEMGRLKKTHVPVERP